jgi:Bacterial pre-peptidase C-terminal domain
MRHVVAVRRNLIWAPPFLPAQPSFKGAPQLYSVEVPAGSSSILARINYASDSAAVIDLYLFDCTGPSCVLAAARTSPTGNVLVSVPNPSPGRWIVYVDPFSVPSGSTQYDYVDLYASAAFGSVSVADATAVHPSGTSWTRTATATAVSQPPAGRSLKGFVSVVGDGVVLKRADVDLLNVH